MKKLYLFLMMLLPAVGFAQTITVSGAGTANYGSWDLNGTYNFAGTRNGKNYYQTGHGFSANGCNNCSGLSTISWDGVQWVLSAEGTGWCSYCEFSSSSIKTNSTATTLNPPCSGWPNGMTVAGACEGGAIQDYALSVNAVCQSGSVTLSWVNNIALGSGNVFTATLSGTQGYFGSGGGTILNSLASSTATSMTVTIPTKLESGEGYVIRLVASQAPVSDFSLTSSAITIGSPNSYPLVDSESKVVCVGEAVHLLTTSSYASYQWTKRINNIDTDIVGATAQSYAMPSVTESDNASYFVTGKSTDGCLSESSSYIGVSVSNAPFMSSISYPNVFACVGNTTEYFHAEMQGSGTFTYDWKKGMDVVKTETTIATTSSYSPPAGWQVADAGQYSVVASKVGCINSATSDIVTAQIDQPITEPPSLSPTGTHTAPVTLTASGSFPQYDLYRWNSTTYILANQSNSGSFNVTQHGKYVVTASNNCGASGYSNEVIVTTICDTPPTITPANPTTLPASLTASTGFADYVWYKWNGSSYQSQNTGSSFNATTAGEYAVRGYSYSCGYSGYSAPVIIADPCANDLIAPSITSFPTTVTASCGATATWNVTATDNCTAAGSITYKYYITGGSAVGDANNLQNGTGSGTAFTANAVVYLFAFDAANNKSAEQTFNVTASTVPDAPNATGVAVGTGEPANLTATNCSTFKWYDQETGGILLHTGQNYTTNPLSVSTTFYVACSNGESCESTRTAVLVNVSCTENTVIVIPTTTNSGPVNSGQSVGLNVLNLAPAGQSASFLGSNSQYIEVQQSPPDDNFTIEMWMKSTEANGGLFSAGSTDINNPYSDRHIYIENGTLKARIIPVGGAEFSSGVVVNDGQWHHIALTHRTTGEEGSRLYVDGRYTSSFPSTISCVSLPLFRIGIEQHSIQNNYFTGSVDQVRVWNVVRTQAEIKSAANLETPESTLGLVFNSNLDGNADATSGASGSLVNGTTFTNVDYYNYAWTGKNAPASGASATQTTTGAAGSSYTVNVTPVFCGTIISGTSAVVINCVQLATLQSGNWSNPEIWSCDRVPNAIDKAKIEAGHTVNLSAGANNVDQLTNNGTLTGSGNIGGSLYNNGTIAPGNSPGTISVLDFTGTTFSVINAEISTQSAYDKLVVTGAAALNGTLNVVFIDAFDPTLGDAFEIITYGSHSGSFGTINLPVLPGTLVWKTEYNATALRLSVIVNPLPVTLVSFSAKVTDNQKVRLAWETSEEVNASHFVVERSVDAKRFEAIGKVLASGTTKQSHSYTLTDETPLSGTSYYRLRQVDSDGKEYVYRVVAVNLESVFKQTVFPNPAGNNMIRLTFEGALPKIGLTDLAGRNVQVTYAETELNELTVKPIFPLAPGLYVLTATHEGRQVVHKVVVTE